MRLTATLLTTLLLLAACSQKAGDTTLPGKTYGGEITISETITLADAAERLDALQGVEVALRGSIQAMCLHKGDWLTWSEGDNQLIVQFKDHAYTIPTEAKGKEVLVQGFLRSEPLPLNCEKAEHEQRMAHGTKTATQIAAEHIVEEAAQDERIVASTAAKEAPAHGEVISTDAAKQEAKPQTQAQEEPEVNRMYFVATAVRVLD